MPFILTTTKLEHLHNQRAKVGHANTIVENESNFTLSHYISNFVERVIMGTMKM